MRAGTRPCRIEIWRPGDATVAGEPNPPPALFRTVYASLFPLRAREREADRQRQALVTYRARIDYIDGAGVTPQMHVRYEGMTFNIVGVMVDFTTRKTIDLDLVEQAQGY